MAPRPPARRSAETLARQILSRIVETGRLVLAGAHPVLASPGRLLSALGDRMPKGLYARSLLIIITPMVLLQAIVTYMFMEKYWQGVTARLSAATTKDIAAIVELYQQLPHDKATTDMLQTVAQKQLALGIEFRPPEELPPRGARPFFDILDQALSDEIRLRIGLPFWIDTVGRSNLIEIRIQLRDSVMRVLARRSSPMPPIPISSSSGWWGPPSSSSRSPSSSCATRSGPS